MFRTLLISTTNTFMSRNKNHPEVRVTRKSSVRNDLKRMRKFRNDQLYILITDYIFQRTEPQNSVLGLIDWQLGSFSIVLNKKPTKGTVDAYIINDINYFEVYVIYSSSRQQTTYLYNTISLLSFFFSCDISFSFKYDRCGPSQWIEVTETATRRLE